MSYISFIVFCEKCLLKIKDLLFVLKVVSSWTAFYKIIIFFLKKLRKKKKIFVIVYHS